MTTQPVQSPFQTTDPNGIPQWKKLFDVVIDKEIGDVISFDELSDIVGYDIKGSRVVIYQTNKHLLDDHDRMLVSVRTVGYKIATATEQLSHAEARPLRAKRQLKKGIKEGEHIDMNKLSRQEKENQMRLMLKLQTSLSTLNKHQHKALDLQQKAIKQQVDANDSITDMQKQLDELKASMKKKDESN